MGTNGKQGLTTPPQNSGLRQQTAPANATSLRGDTLAATEAYVKQTYESKRSYAKAAFANPYNLSLFIGGLIASGITFSPFLALIVVATELLWMVFAPGSKLLQKLLWDPLFDREDSALEQQRRSAQLQN